ncbi:hypothetical protein [Actinoplanes palleronii]|uniref:Uncharacterized protein n=1 Tax=Actinoplanes palleronii TaxID=113570 RepID=A0ABQ4BRV6_9ACTN|nr:hypothetical protein [Actinoplanes palleronii]GIE73400.1 hypothetical protein Apa02nite_095080 [Actinoplanes palleronii]
MSGDESVILGRVVAPSRALVLAGTGFLDEWSELGDPLSVRALHSARAGGAHLHDWLAEATAVPTGPATLTVTARTRPGTYEPRPTIAVLDIDLDLPWSAVSAGTEPVPLGALPVDPCGMAIGDPVALDAWIGFGSGPRTVDGLADLRLGGKGDTQASTHFSAPEIVATWTLHGWLDLPITSARERATTINQWAVAHGHYKFLAKVNPHTHQHLGWRAGWPDPLGAGLIEIAGCPILCITWSPSELQRFRGGRSHGQVYPVTLEDVDGRATLRWRIGAWTDESERTNLDSR